MVVSLEIAQLRFSMPHSVNMVTWSGTSLYHTLASSHLLSIQIMVDLPKVGYLLMTLMTRHYHLLQLSLMTNNASR